jgi:hypothetical protein
VWIQNDKKHLPMLGLLHISHTAPSRTKLRSWFFILALLLTLVPVFAADWDDLQQSPCYCYREEGAFVQGWFNDEQAWRLKLNWVKEKGLGAIGLCALDGVNDSPERGPVLRALQTKRLGERSPRVR